MASTTNYGATPDDWLHFDLVMGLGQDLLPVVSNPKATLSPDSKIKEIGKTPSRYNASRKVVGIPAWTAHISSDQDIERWSAEPDYGICLQTRTVRALDIDVGDGVLANTIVAVVERTLGHSLPIRQRDNSGKCLLAFTLPGDMPKRKMEVEGGIVEFLATGQQFVAIGTHPSGVRYEWVGGLPAQFPELTLDEFEALWAALAERFAIGEVSSGALTMRKKGEHVARLDPVADHLMMEWGVLGTDRDGAMVIACPWEDDHTTGSRGDGSTVWFPAGTNGYDKGHFKCLHGHCQGRTDGDFFAAVGYVEDVAGEFDVVEHQGEAKDCPLPPFKRDKNGKIEATVENVTMALRRSDVCGMDIRFDTFRDEIMWTAAPGQWQPFTDPDYVRLRITLEKGGFKPIGRELIRDVVLLIADESRFDTAVEWLSGLQWDGVPRVEGFLTEYFGADDSAYSRAVSVYLWTALAGRVMVPGVQADMALVLVGAQGAGKTTAVKAMVPAAEHFVEIRLDKRDEDTARELRGKLVGELGELRGLMSRDSEDIKAWISRTHEEWVPKYREFSVKFPRRLVFIGTTNRHEFLVDDTGNRRWLPVHVNEVKPVEVRRDHLQLWAEAREIFKLRGVEYRAAEKLAEAVHDQHMVKDAWADIVCDWLDEADPLTGDKPRTRNFLRIVDVLKGALRFDERHIGLKEERRLGAILRTFGYTRKKVREDGRLFWAFVPDVPD